MKSLVALLLVAQLLSCRAVPVSEVLPLQIDHLLDCDDPQTEEAAAVAVNYINNHLKHGYKFSLNRIENVIERPAGTHEQVLDLELDLVETTCHIVSPVPAEKCTVRSRMEHAVEGDCDVKVAKDKGHYHVLKAKCHSSPDSHEDFLKFCPDCPRLSLLNDTEVINIANAALAEYNAANTTHGHYKLLEIARGHHLHLARGTNVEFAVVQTNCSKEHAKEHVEDCHAETGENEHYGFCKASFHKSIEVDKPEEHQVACTVYDHQPGVHHTHLIKEHVEGSLGQAGQGFAHHDLIHSHKGESHSHSHSDEVPPVTVHEIPAPVEKVASLVKRAVALVAAVCPGRYRHFEL